MTMKPWNPLLGLALSVAAVPAVAQQQTWPVNSMDRPRPPVVDPGPPGPPAPAPADAIVLLAGNDLSEWQAEDGGPAKWRQGDGYIEIVPGTGAIHTRRRFGDVQLHVEWASPAEPEGSGQERGNSGVFLMSHYEVQVLDCWHNDTYADGQAAALYGQTPPLVNASRPPGQWQSYDIVFRAPRFGKDGTVLSPARATVFHNGVLVQDNVALTGSTVHGRTAVYQPHDDRMPLLLQDHNSPVRFRNIWIRELSPR
jgi:3-keto-disaccharide hydrolase